MPKPTKPEGTRRSKGAADKGAKSDLPRVPVTTDPRFSTIHNDPRFAPPKRKDTKVTLDSRFKSVLSDDRFSSKTAVDRYGRKQSREEGRRELERFYDLDDEEDAESESGSGSDDDEAVAKPKYDPARGEGIIDGSDSSSDEDSDDDPGYEEGVTEEAVQDDVPTGEVSRRFAVVNLDWDHVRAVDLMKAFSGFGKVKRVSIFPSEFGKERMEREEMEGPPREIFQSAEADDLPTEDEDEDENLGVVKEDKGEEFDSVKLRKYQLERLRYYYAVVECESEKAAKLIYDNCDGAEYEASANFFDLRFVPDDTTFDDPPRDTCDREPAEYTPSEFVTDALQHSKVKLTWDEDDAQRKEVSKRAFSRRDIEDNELAAYLASDSDSAASDAEDTAAKYRALLGGLTTGGPVAAPSGAMEVTFTSGLIKDNGKVIQDDSDEGLTTIEKYAKKEKARRNARKEKARLTREAANGETPATAKKTAEEEEEEADGKKDEDLGFDDPFFDEPTTTNAAAAKASKQAARDARAAATAENDARKDELEAIMTAHIAANGKPLEHFDMKQVIKAEKVKKLKNRSKKSAKKKIDTDVVQEDFKMDVKDPRFQAVFDRHDFAIDPTNPRFVKTEAMGEMMEERRKRGEGRRRGDKEDAEGEKGTKRRRKEKGDEVGELVRSLKKKAKTQSKA